MPNRKLILLMSVSLDGFAARRDHSLDWFLREEDPDRSDGRARQQATTDLLRGMGLIVLGRRACVDMAPAWSSSEGGVADLMNALPKVVFSSTLDGVDWNDTRVSRRSVEDEIPELKAEAGGDIICFGGASFANGLAAARLIDEYRLTIHPVALGDGLPLLHGLPEPQPLELVSSTVYPRGSLANVYVPRG
jgi:dihydrofolate reductase